MLAAAPWTCPPAPWEAPRPCSNVFDVVVLHRSYSLPPFTVEHSSWHCWRAIARKHLDLWLTNRPLYQQFSMVMANLCCEGFLWRDGARFSGGHTARVWGSGGVWLEPWDEASVQATISTLWQYWQRTSPPEHPATAPEAAAPQGSPTGSGGSTGGAATLAGLRCHPGDAEIWLRTGTPSQLASLHRDLRAKDSSRRHTTLHPGWWRVGRRSLLRRLRVGTHTCAVAVLTLALAQSRDAARAPAGEEAAGCGHAACGASATCLVAALQQTRDLYARKGTDQFKRKAADRGIHELEQHRGAPLRCAEDVAVLNVGEKTKEKLVRQCRRQNAGRRSSQHDFGWWRTCCSEMCTRRIPAVGPAVASRRACRVLQQSRTSCGRQAVRPASLAEVRFGSRVDEARRSSSKPGRG